MGQAQRTIELSIRGMDCAECALHIEERLNKIEGVGSAHVLLAAEKGIVSFDAGRVEPAALVRAVNELGYRAATETGQDGQGRAATLANTARFALLATVALLALVGLLAERVGLVQGALERIPVPLVLLAILFGGYPIFKSAILGLRARQINADLLMTVAIAGAAALGEFVSAALIVFFMSIAHWLESFTTEKSRAAIRQLIELAPKTARVIVDGVEIETPVDRLQPGDTIVVRPGERVPADGAVSKGASAVDQSPITGESVAIAKHPGDTVFAGSVNQRGVLQITATRVGADSTLGRIIRLVEEAEAAKAPVQRFADRYSALYLPVVIGVALLTFAITRNPVNALAVLVVACPCAIALATPLAVVAGVGRAAGKGILIKGGLYLEALAKVDVLVMDKTGTLTFGRPRVTDVLLADSSSTARAVGPVDKDPERVILRLAASADKYSEHPLASAILEHAAQQGISIEPPASFEVVAGHGVVAQLDGRLVVFGNRRLMQEHGIALGEQDSRRAHDLEEQGKTVMFVAASLLKDAPEAGAAQGQLVGLIAVADVVRQSAPEAIRRLRELGIRRMVLLTGDNARVASALAQQLGVEFCAEMLPEDKIEYVRDLQRQGHRVAMIGDGINDAPALAQADVGIAMGAAGTDIAMEAAPIALMTDDWAQVPAAVHLARRTFRTIQQNIAFGLLFNVAGLALASVGILTPVMAAAAQSLPDVVVFANSSRLLRS